MDQGVLVSVSISRRRFFIRPYSRFVSLVVCQNPDTEILSIPLSSDFIYTFASFEMFLQYTDVYFGAWLHQFNLLYCIFVSCYVIAHDELRSKIINIHAFSEMCVLRRRRSRMGRLMILSSLSII